MPLNMSIDEDKLIKALVQDDFTQIEKLITEYGVNATDSFGRSFLINCVIKNKYNFVKKLLEYDNIDVNIQDENGFTAIHFAIEEGYPKILKEILSTKGVNINLKDKFGNTPLWRAVHNKPEEKESIWMLIKNKANVNIENEYGISALKIMQEDDEDGQYSYKDIFEYIKEE
ncbi:ankyrin repeat domain-containing protein [Algibacter lectus]|uniref:Ankyrin repeat protein n=1 Tax=Algibacter lectus TaxID=221126 RepID=A0A4R8MEA7_9FLAO|nr:ankyrin repeat domain-containing protein [Algibacter lectus]MWW23125.1 hypothetical protein [Algibacter lectus]TDY64199.1 ankyrin repeat protein [Algibacter lectus]